MTETDAGGPGSSWPIVLQPLAAQLVQTGPSVVVAEYFARSSESESHDRTLTAGLVDVEEFERIPVGDELGHLVDASGPRPTPPRTFTSDPEYEPRFWIHGGATLGAGIEPLVPSWRSHIDTTFMPDLGFLMTYALVPRVLDKNGELRWDDPTLPRRDVVVSRPHTLYN